MDITKTTHSDISVFSNREIKRIVGDGSCMFRCLSQHLFNNQDKHQVVRQLICDFEIANPTIFKVYLTSNQSQSIHEHVQLISKENSWGTQVELIAAATYFKVPIYVYEYSSMSSTGKWICVKPIDNKKQLHFYAINTIEQVINVPSHFELYHTKDVHYDCIVSKDTGFVSTVPPFFDKTESYLDIEC